MGFPPIFFGEPLKTKSREVFDSGATAFDFSSLSSELFDSAARGQLESKPAPSRQQPEPAAPPPPGKPQLHSQWQPELAPEPEPEQPWWRSPPLSAPEPAPVPVVEAQSPPPAPGPPPMPGPQPELPAADAQSIPPGPQTQPEETQAPVTEQQPQPPEEEPDPEVSPLSPAEAAQQPPVPQPVPEEQAPTGEAPSGQEDPAGKDVAARVQELVSEFSQRFPDTPITTPEPTGQQVEVQITPEEDAQPQEGEAPAAKPATRRGPKGRRKSGFSEFFDRLFY